MDYIYDIVLNFQNDYYDFFEWLSTDKVINIKKIPIYLVNNENYLNLKYNEITLDKSMLPKQIKMFLVSSGVEVMGILLDSNGNIIKRSSLLLDEEAEILEEKENIKVLPLKYIKNIFKPHIVNSRLQLEKKKYLDKFFSKTNIKNDEYLLKYIYYEIYNKEEPDIKKVSETLKELINNDTNKLYDSIKKVSMELKK